MAETQADLQTYAKNHQPQYLVRPLAVLNIDAKGEPSSITLPEGTKIWHLAGAYAYAQLPADTSKKPAELQPILIIVSLRIGDEDGTLLIDVPKQSWTWPSTWATFIWALPGNVVIVARGADRDHAQAAAMETLVGRRSKREAHAALSTYTPRIIYDDSGVPAYCVDVLE